MTFKLNTLGYIALVSCTLLFSSCGKKQAANRESEMPTISEEKQLPTITVVKVQKLKLNSQLKLPGELLAYQNVPIHAKVEGYIKWIGVDRGSIVKKGQEMITIFCPELEEKVKEGMAKLASAESSYKRAQSTEESVKSKLVEAQARLDADSLTFQRLERAAKTPGAVAQNEVDIQQKAVESDHARVESIKQEIAAAKNLVLAEDHNVQAAREVLNAIKDMNAYLTIKAPFDGVITERNVHEGSIVAVDAARNASALPLLRIQQKDILRLVVSIPESSISGMTLGQQIEFSVPAYIGKAFYGVVARPGYALDTSTRTMPVELNVYNTDGSLEPGMFATVHWLVTRPYETLFVPYSSVDSDLKGTYVNRVKDNVIERIPVQRGLSMNNLVEISGDVAEADTVALKATNELKTGTHVIIKVADENDLKDSVKHSSAGGE